MNKILFCSAILVTAFFSSVGCTEKPSPKTEDPVEIEKIRQTEAARSQREIQGKP
jgi:hypothetical protein